ncbi:MAG TPA: dihydroneopterin aldolase [Gemmatimonadaceae bacterium]|nr:dihydroneopterin aldolase [Gemmatimonadaceae bacterium]
MNGRHEITLRSMRFHALVGILPHERTTAQPIEVDLTVRVVQTPRDGVVDYRALYALVAQVVSGGPIDYLEEVADAIVKRALTHSPRVRSARVAVRKPHVALGGPLDFAEVVAEGAADA